MLKLPKVLSIDRHHKDRSWHSIDGFNDDAINIFRQPKPFPAETLQTELSRF